MKTLTPLFISQSEGKVTIEFSISDRTFGKNRTQQVTCLHFAEGNPRWVRHVQMSNEALFVKRFRDGLALDLEEWVTKVANVLEPKLASPPSGRVIKTPDVLNAEISSELHPKFQWQSAPAIDTPSDQWKNIDGATSATLNIGKELKGQFVRCFANSDAGNLATPPVAV